jgi:hypothetical protein
MTNITGKLILRSNKRKYIKVKRNQLLLLDALLNDGGYSKKYLDRSKNVRFSEHSGHLGLNESSIDRIIVSARTTREDTDDKEILLPHNLSDTYEYEYFFHTHPPTPYPGARAKDGIMYEFPSISDIFHFIDHYNMGKTIGSIVVAPEGYYIIYPKDFSIKKIKYDAEIEDEIFAKMEDENNLIQEKALQIYGDTFDEEYYYSKISLDDKYLKMFNSMVNKYLDNQLKIIIKHRSKDNMTGKWILKNLYLPV